MTAGVSAHVVVAVTGAGPAGEAALAAGYSAVAVTAISAYLAGESSLRARGARRARPRIAEPILFLSGWAVLTLVTLSPVTAPLESSLTGHMVEHMLVVLVVAPLLVLGRPGPRWMRAVGVANARRAVRLSRTSAGRAVARAVDGVVPVWIAFAIGLWSWHEPRLYDAAVRQPVVHLVQHACFLLLAVACARTLAPGRPRPGWGGGVVALAATGMHSAVLGALLVFAAAPVYATYSAGDHAAALADQQVAGVVMWVGGAPFVLVAVAVLLLRALRERPSTPVRGGAARTTVTGLGRS